MGYIILFTSNIKRLEKFHIFNSFWLTTVESRVFKFFMARVHLSCKTCNYFVRKQWIQESIPVGCVPPASVTTTRCQQWGCTFRGEGKYLPGGVPLHGVPFDGGVPSRYTHPHTPRKGPGIRHTSLWTEWDTPVKTLPSLNFVGGR